MSHCGILQKAASLKRPNLAENSLLVECGLRSVQSSDGFPKTGENIELFLLSSTLVIRVISQLYSSSSEMFTKSLWCFLKRYIESCR